MPEAGNKLILWVEDDPTSATVLRTIKDDGTYGIARADTISAAINRITNEPGIEYFNYIVVDLDMPYKEKDFTEEENDALSKMTETSIVTLSGWLWLKKYILDKHPEYEMDQIIIYSRYTENLPEQEKEISSQLKAVINKLLDGPEKMYAALDMSW